MNPSRLDWALSRPEVQRALDVCESVAVELDPTAAYAAYREFNKRLLAAQTEYDRRAALGERMVSA